MKKILLALLVIGFAGTGAAAVEPGVQINSISPQPSEPGDVVTLHVVLSNDGTTSATFRPVEVETVDRVEVIGTTDRFSSGFSLCGGCQMVGNIRLKVDEDAVSGTYPVDVALQQVSGAGIVQTAELEMDGTPNLVVSSPAIKAVPGENVTADIEVRNIGTDTASQTVLEMDEDDFSMQPSPLELGRIEPAGTVIQEVVLSVDKELSNGIERLDIEASYMDESNDKTEDASITVDVLERAEVVVSSFDPRDATVGAAETVTMTLENLGPGEAQRIVAELACGESADVLAGRAFVGQLDDEESVPVTFTLIPRRSTADCEVEIAYSDAQQNSATESLTFAAARQGTSPLLIGLAVVAVIAAAFYWRRTRKQDELAEI